MAYLTFDEWKTNYNFVELEQSDFERFERKAAIALDNLTQGFYEKYSLEYDVPTRRNAFKKALALTIEQMDLTGAENEAYAQSMNLTSISIGRTSLSSGGKDSSNGLSVIAPESKRILARVGLLYLGIVYNRHGVTPLGNNGGTFNPMQADKLDKISEKLDDILDSSIDTGEL